MARNVGKEIHFHKEFLRFEELEAGILYAQIGPKNNIITFLMPHFADRLPLENFVIHDVKRNIFALHEAKKTGILYTIRWDWIELSIPFLIKKSSIANCLQLFSYNSNKRTGKSDVAIEHVATSLSGVYDRVPTKCENFLKRRNFTLQMKNGVIIFMEIKKLLFIV